MMKLLLLSTLFFATCSIPAKGAIVSARSTQKGSVQMEFATSKESCPDGVIISYVNTLFSSVFLYGIANALEWRLGLDFREAVLLENDRGQRNNLSGYSRQMFGPGCGPFPEKGILPQLPQTGDIFMLFTAGKYFMPSRSTEAGTAVFMHTLRKITNLLYNTGVIPGLPHEQAFYACYTDLTRNDGFCSEPLGDFHPEGPGTYFPDPGFITGIIPIYSSWPHKGTSIKAGQGFF